jgi:uncharacterized protein (TIGR02266 family)
MANMPGLFREYMALDKRRGSPDGLNVAELRRWTELKGMLSKHFQPGAKKTGGGSDQRASVRVPVNLRMGFESYGEIRESLMTNLSRGGLFIATSQPLPLSSVIKLRLRIEESQQEIEVEAEVVALNSGPGLKTEELGMGVKFVRMTPEQAKGVDQLYERSVQRALVKNQNHDPN